METINFKINKKEYCHITDDILFITNEKDPSRIPLEHELSEAWGIVSILNYLVFIFLLVYIAFSVSYYEMNFFKYFINYGALFLLFRSMIRVKDGFNSSTTPTISRAKIKSIYLKTPKFSFPRLVIYFSGPEGKVLRRIIPIANKKATLPLLKEAGLIK